MTGRVQIILGCTDPDNPNDPGYERHVEWALDTEAHDAMHSNMGWAADVMYETFFLIRKHQAQTTK